jgi:hypothetical protein
MPIIAFIQDEHSIKDIMKAQGIPDFQATPPIPKFIDAIEAVDELPSLPSTGGTGGKSVSVMTSPLFRPTDLWRMRSNAKFIPRRIHKKLGKS